MHTRLKYEHIFARKCGDIEMPACYD
jgi:hypothetical protein